MLELNQIPAAELSIVCVSVYGGQDAEDHPVWEVEIWDREANSRFTIPAGPVNCDSCGHSLKHVCVIEHKPTGRFYCIGRDCAARIQGLAGVAGLEAVSLSLATRLAARQREAAALAAATDDFRRAYQWTKDSGHAPAIARDIQSKVVAYGAPSHAQQDLLVKIWREDVSRRAVVTAVFPSGRTTVTGTVLSLRQEDGPYGPCEKMLVDIDGLKAWGTKPSAAQVEKGQKITITATFTQSRNDNLFGFFSRPRIA